MYPRVEYEMSEADLEGVLKACAPVPYILVGGVAPRSAQDRANDAWADLGRRMGFDPMSVQPVPGKGQRFFTAIPSETADQRAARLAREAEGDRLAEIASLEDEIRQRQERLAALKGEGK